MKTETLNLGEEYELKGHWFIPINDEYKTAAGILFLSPNEIKLKLFVNGHDHDLLPFLGGLKANSFDIINGQLLTGEPVTLLDSFFIGGRDDTTDLASNYCFVGKSFDYRDNINFDSFIVYQEDTSKWLHSNTSGITTNNENIIIEVQKPKKDFEIKANDNLKISNFYSTSWSHGISQPVEYEQKIHLKFESIHIAFTFKDILDYIYEWNIIKSIMVGRPCNINYLIGVNNKTNIHIYYMKEKFANKDLLALEMILPYHSIKDCLPNILKSWFNNNDKIKALAKELFFNGFCMLNKISKEKYLELIQSVEGLATIKKQKYYIDPKSGIIEKLQKKIAEELTKLNIDNNDIIEAFVGKLPNCNNQVSLTSILKKFILEEFEPELLYKLKIDEHYVKKIVDLRHQLSHNKGQSPYDLNFKELQDMIDKLIIILIYYFAVDNEVPPEIVKRGILENCTWTTSFIRTLVE